MHIDAGSSLIQNIQARQAFQARPTAPAQNIPTGPAPVEVPRAEPEPGRPGLNSIPYRDIQQVASKAGFVGLTETDIRQAYLRGESLLTDYRV